MVILAFDFGLRRIGVAVGQIITQSASPLPVLLAEKGRTGLGRTVPINRRVASYSLNSWASL